MKINTSIFWLRKIKIITSLSILSLIAISAWFYTYNTNATKDDCKYTQEIEACVQANKDWKNREIDSPVCINSLDKEKIAYNIVLDKKFKEIDKKIEEYLAKIEQWKDEFFWVNANRTVFDAMPEFNKAFSTQSTWFYKEYSDICECKWSDCESNIILKETLACVGKWSTLTSSYFIKNNNGDNICMSLAKTKLAVYRQIAIDLLKLNKKQVKKDYSKKYMQEQRTKYDNLIENMSINKNYINKIDQKWNVKTKNAN